MSESPRKDPLGLDAELDDMMSKLDADLDAALGQPLTSPSRPAAASSFARRSPAAQEVEVGEPFARPLEFNDASGLTISCLATINALSDHTALPTVPKVSFRNRTGRAYANLRVVIGGGRSPYIGQWSASIGRLPPGQSWSQADVRLPLFNHALRNVVEQTKDAITVEVLDGPATVAVRTIDVDVQPYNHWPMVFNSMWTLAAFVWPNQAAVQELIKRAATVQQQQCGRSSFEGYQGMASNPDRVRQQVASLHDVLGPAGIGLNYINPPASFKGADGRFGQKIRFPNAVVADGRGTCLDLTVLLASLLEQVNIDPILVLIGGHAFVGYWADPDHELGGKEVELTEDENARALYESGRIEVLNSTDMTSGGDFAVARRVGRQIVDERLRQARDGGTFLTTFVRLIDVRACRKAGVVPLPPL